MKVDTDLPDKPTADYIVLEEDFFSKGRMFGIVNTGGSIVIGNFSLLIAPEGDDHIRFELRYTPKGNFYTPEYFAAAKKKKKKISGDAEVIDEVEL